MGDAENVYASATQVFVATTAWPYPVAPVCHPFPARRARCWLRGDGAGDNASTGIYGTGTYGTGTYGTGTYGTGRGQHRHLRLRHIRP